MKKLLAPLILIAALGGCASLPPPTAEVEAAKVAIGRAENADAGQLAGAVMTQARNYYEQANAELSKGNETEARPLFNRAAVTADLAYAQAIAQVKANDAEARQKQLQELRAKMNAGGQ